MSGVTIVLRLTSNGGVIYWILPIQSIPTILHIHCFDYGYGGKDKSKVDFEILKKNSGVLCFHMVMNDLLIMSGECFNKQNQCVSLTANNVDSNNQIELVQRPLGVSGGIVALRQSRAGSLGAIAADLSTVA